MPTASHPASGLPSESRGLRRSVTHEVWPSLTIGVIWLVVLADALFGPDVVISNASGFTRLPSAVILAFFAWLATRVVAKYGFDPHDDKAE
jgi:hypothetical protein